MRQKIHKENILVSDRNDPSGLGMFSNAGRFANQKYSIFQKKDEILQNKRRFIRVSKVPVFKVIYIIFTSASFQCGRR